MKRAILMLFAAMALAACQSTGGVAKPAADIAARVCPPLQGVLALLPVTQGISPETLAKVEQAAPYVAAACAPGAASALDLTALSTQAAPLLIQAVSASSLSDGEKQAAILAVVAAQVVIAEWGAQ